MNKIIYNEPFADILGKLESILSKNGEPFRARAYKKAQETIMLFSAPITSVDQLKGSPNIGSTILERLNEYVTTGSVALIEKDKENPMNLFLNVYGIGPKKSEELVKTHGVTTIEELRTKQNDLLNDVQKVGLKYYEDILLRIPRQEIVIYENTLNKIFDLVVKNVAPISADNNSKMEIVGSYRRGAQESGDIDVIITSSFNNASGPNVFKLFIDVLIKQRIILEVLSRGSSKCLVIANIPGSKRARRVDFLYSPPDEYAFALLYFTGSKIFNTTMRQRAVDLGYTLNEHCISVVVNAKEKVIKKVDKYFPDEKSIFDFLKMDYKEPRERTGLFLESISSFVTNKSNKKEELLMKFALFKQNGVPLLNTYSENELKELVDTANDAYHNHQPLISDNEFDVLQEFFINKFHKEKEEGQGQGKKIGAKVPAEKNKVKLPYEMASMDKIKPDTCALQLWKQKYTGPYVLSCKLDGVSGLYSTKGSAPSLYTRGDGKIGQDISNFLPFLKMPSTKNVVIRGEFIIAKQIFEAKYATTFANPRNMVAGIINRVTIDAATIQVLKDVHFVAYEVIYPTLKQSEQFNYLRQIGATNIAKHAFVENITNEMLSEWLISTRSQYLYETDGVIVCDDKIYARESGNPSHAFAFKMVLGEQCAEAKVVGVIWSPSKDGYLKPRVQIEPIVLGGVKIEYATGFNAAFIKQHKIGVGALIQLVRSGDVIPHIKAVITGASEANMPQCDYKWNETGVDIILENASENETVLEKNITLFFKGIEVDGLSSGGVAKLIKAGFDSISKIVHMTKEEMSKIEGFGEKSANKICDGIKTKLQSASIVTIMSASNIFGRGFGERKLQPIMEMFPNILVSNESKEEKMMKVLLVKGIAQKSAELFVDNIATFNQFYNTLGEPTTQMVCGNGDACAQTTNGAGSIHPLFKKTVVLTGFRDKTILEFLKNVGAISGASVSKNTFVVVTKTADESETSEKINSAKKLQIPILCADEFLKKYKNEK